MPTKTYVVVGYKPWNQRVFDELLSTYPGQWFYIDAKQDLTPARLAQIKPRYLFFLHWSWKVPDDILKEYECIVFHMTDVPYGRGGSPLQNLIVRGHRTTKLTALRMTNEFDAGPVYLKRDLSLEGSSAEEIYIRASYLSAKMMRVIVEDNIEPVPQIGEPTNFKRRKPHQSEIPELDSLQELHDFIRMLDADGYPKAFIDYNGFRYQFNRAVLYDGRVVADVHIERIEDEIG
jgi:methionyl-tRNA formyltransferase